MESLVKLLLLLENALILNSEVIYLNENLNPLQVPTHTLPYQYTHRIGQKLSMDLSWHMLGSKLQA